jgi:zinc transport system ATP-binding protein
VTDPDILISIEGVSFSYGNTKVLDHVTFPIRSGDFLSIIGPNGSGKTTLIKIILGLLNPSEGRIQIFGKNGETFNRWEKLGYVPQKATHVDPFFPVSVKEVVEMGLVSSRKFFSTQKKDDEGHIRRALIQVGMEAYVDWRIGKLSGGQQQRVFIARAIVNQPQILFLDEPTTGVDGETQEHFYDMLDDLNKKESITIVLITHDIGVVNKHVSQVACLHQILQYHGSHEEFCQSETFKKMITEGHHVISHRH